MVVTNAADQGQRFTVAIVRFDGALFPFAADDAGRWERAWPAADEATDVEVVDNVPSVWRRRGAAYQNSGESASDGRTWNASPSEWCRGRRGALPASDRTEGESPQHKGRAFAEVRYRSRLVERSVGAVEEIRRFIFRDGSDVIRLCRSRLGCVRLCRHLAVESCWGALPCAAAAQKVFRRVLQVGQRQNGYDFTHNGATMTARAMVLVAVVLQGALTPGLSAQDAAGFAGEWPATKDSKGITSVRIVDAPSGRTVQAFAAGTPRPCDWGIVPPRCRRPSTSNARR